jgi:hypothetical protein
MSRMRMVGLPFAVILAIGLIVAICVAPSASAASSADPSAVDSLIHSYFAAQDAARLPGGSTSAMNGLYKPGNQRAATLARYEATTAEQFHAWVAFHKDRYASLSTTFVVGDTAFSDGTATVNVSARTEMRWQPGSSPDAAGFTAEKAASMAVAKDAGRLFDSGDAITSMVSTQHRFTIDTSAANPTILEDLYNDPFNATLADDHVSPAGAVSQGKAQAAPGVRPETALNGPSGQSMSYDRYAAATYADTWAGSRNSLYLNYDNPSGSGGDCANFVSQSLYDANGANLPYEDAWHYTYGETNPDLASPIAWRYTPSQHSFFTANPWGSGYNFAYLGASGGWSATNAYDKNSMLIGDVIFYDWAAADGLIDHTSIAVAYLADGTTLIDAHNTDFYHMRYDFNLQYDNGTGYFMDRMNSTIYY